MVLIFLMLPFAANIVVLPPPLDMAKEAICALLAIFGCFFWLFLPLAHGRRARRTGEVPGGQIRTGGEQAGDRQAEKQRRTGEAPDRQQHQTVPIRLGVGGKQVDSRLESEGNSWSEDNNGKDSNDGRKTMPGMTATMGRTAMTGRKPGEARERPARTLSRPLSGANEAADGERQCLRKFHLELSLLISNLPSVGVLSAMEMSAYFSSVPGTLLGMILYVPSVSCSILQSCSGAPVN